MSITTQATPQLRRALEATVQRRFGTFGGVERRGGVPVSDIPVTVDIRTSGDPKDADQMLVKGYASVFNRLSLDLGGFREKILPTAFDNVLTRDPHTLLLWDHDGQKILGSSRATDPESLELRIDQNGLRFFSRVVKTSYAEDLRALMNAGIVKQASFAFTVGSDSWSIDKEENVTRTIIEVADLFDVTITAMGAYPQTASSLVRSAAYDFAVANGRLLAGATHEEVAPDGEGTSTVDVAQVAGVETVPSRQSGGADQQAQLDVDEARARLDQLKTDIRRRNRK